MPKNHVIEAPLFWINLREIDTFCTPLDDPNNKSNVINATTNDNVISTSNTEENEYSNTQILDNDIPNLVDDEDDSALGVSEMMIF